MSFFDRGGIPVWLLKAPKTAEETIRARGQGEAGELESDDGVGDDTDGGFEDDVAMLRDYCLIVTGELGDELEMLGLVQLSTRKWLEVAGQQETFKQKCIERIAASFPTGEYENWAVCRSLFPHVQVALGYRPSEDTVETWATLLYNGGWYAWSQGRYDVAQEMVGKAREVREKRLGMDDVVTLDTISLFALVLSDQGRWEEAEKLFVQVMEASKTKLGANHPDTLSSMANVASVYRNQGRWEEAEKLGGQVMETSKTMLGADHPDMLSNMANLASTYRNQGRLSEAEKLEVQVMETRKTKLGADHPDTLTSMNNLAFTWKGQGRQTDALAMMEDCAQARRRVLGEEHPDTLSSLADIAKWSS